MPTVERRPDVLSSERLDEIYDGIWQDVVRLHAKWRIVRQLFADGLQRQYLYEKAPDLFLIVEEALIEGIIMSFSRLTDKEKTSGKENLSFALLLALLKGSDVQFDKCVEELLEDLQTRCKWFRGWRNRAIAHADKSTVLGYHARHCQIFLKKWLRTHCRKLVT